MIILDNVSTIPEWLSDALCKAVTGDSIITRTLYTDGEPTTKRFRRNVMLTSIEAGALREDLVDRIIRIDLEKIDAKQRRSDEELVKPFRQRAPRILGGLYATASKVLAALPTVEPEELPRLASFGKILAALDAACPELSGGHSLTKYLQQTRRQQADLIDGDAFAETVFRLADGPDGWSGSASDLLAAIAPPDGVKLDGWPKSARAMGQRLKRLAPALRAVGVEVEPGKASDRSRSRTWTIRPVAKQSQNNVPIVRNVRNAENDGDEAGRSADDAGGQADVSRPERPTLDAGGDVSDVPPVPPYGRGIDEPAMVPPRGAGDGRERFRL